MPTHTNNFITHNVILHTQMHPHISNSLSFSHTILLNTLIFFTPHTPEFKHTHPKRIFYTQNGIIIHTPKVDYYTHTQSELYTRTKWFLSHKTELLYTHTKWTLHTHKVISFRTKRNHYTHTQSELNTHKVISFAHIVVKLKVSF